MHYAVVMHVFKIYHVGGRNQREFLTNNLTAPSHSLNSGRKRIDSEGGDAGGH